MTYSARTMAGAIICVDIVEQRRRSVAADGRKSRWSNNFPGSDYGACLSASGNVPKRPTQRTLTPPGSMTASANESRSLLPLAVSWSSLWAQVHHFGQRVVVMGKNNSAGSGCPDFIVAIASRFQILEGVTIGAAELNGAFDGVGDWQHSPERHRRRHRRLRRCVAGQCPEHAGRIPPGNLETTCSPFSVTICRDGRVHQQQRVIRFGVDADRFAKRRQGIQQLLAKRPRRGRPCPETFLAFRGVARGWPAPFRGTDCRPNRRLVRAWRVRAAASCVRWLVA